MDKKSIIGLSLIGAIIIGWVIWALPSEDSIRKKKEEQARVADSIQQVKNDQKKADSLLLVQTQRIDDSLKLLKDTVVNALPDSVKLAYKDSVDKANKVIAFGQFSSHASKSDERIRLENDKYVLEIGRRGGFIYSAKLKGYRSFHSYMTGIDDTLDIMIPGSNVMDITMSVSGGKIVHSGELLFDVVGKPFTITGDETASISLRAPIDGDSTKYLEFVYTLKGNDNMMDWDIRFKGLDKVIDQGQNAMDMRWMMASPHQERSIEKERERSSVYYKKDGGSVDNFGSDGKGKKENMKALKWVSYKQQFFNVTLVAKEKFPMDENKVEYIKDKEDTSFTVIYDGTLPIPYTYSTDETFGMQLYMGTNHYYTLKSYDLDMEDQINLGPFFLISWINKGVIWVFNTFQNMHLRYGIIILLLTIIIKLITTPLTYKSFVSSAKMRLLKPEVDEIGLKFPDAADALKKQQAIMQMYRKAGVSPLAGCIPALLQMPILLAMFSFFPSAVELRQQPLFWAVDLSTYDSVLTLPFDIPFYGSHVSLFTLLMTATTLVYTMMSSSQLNTGGPQAKQMKIMMFIMPILFLGVLNSYSAALSYYYFLSNLISIGLTLFIRKFLINETKLHAQLEENKKKPVKKSKWMQRLEDLQKVREEQARTQRGGNKNSKGSGNKNNKKK